MSYLGIFSADQIKSWHHEDFASLVIQLAHLLKLSGTFVLYIFLSDVLSLWSFYTTLLIVQSIILYQIPLLIHLTSIVDFFPPVFTEKRNSMLALTLESRCFAWTQYSIFLSVWSGCCLFPWNSNRCNYSGKKKALSIFTLFTAIYIFFISTS